MAISPFSAELREEERFAGFDASDIGDTFELERMDVNFPDEDVTEILPEGKESQEQEIVAEKLPNQESAIEKVEHQEETSEIKANIQREEKQNAADRELLELLQAELSASSAKQSEQKPEPSIVAAPSFEFVDVTNDPQTREFNFDNIEAKHPSEYSSEQADAKHETDFEGGYASYAAMADIVTNNNAENVSEQTEKPSKRRKALYLSIAAGLLLTIVLGAAGYLLLPKILHFANGSTQTDSTNKHSSPIPSSNLKLEKPNEDLTQHVAVKPIDTLDTTISAETENKEKRHIAETHDEVSNSKLKIEDKAPVQADATKQKKKDETAIVASDFTIKKQPKEINIKREQPRETESIPKVEKIAAKSKNQSDKPVAPGSVLGLYTVQVYSTPSKDDAEEWLERLRAKQINGGFVSNQIIRGQTWYRIRFGSYSSREEAESAARNNGFSKSWIDRVK